MRTQLSNSRMHHSSSSAGVVHAATLVERPSRLPAASRNAATSVIANSVANGNGSSNGKVGATTVVANDEESIIHYAPEEVFSCPEESLFYSQCLQRVLGGALAPLAVPSNGSSMPGPLVVEFGAGDGSPVIDALIKVGPRFQGRVHGFELNPRAASIARRRCNQLGLNNKYKIHHSCFFKGAESLRGSDSSNEAWLVANPPYIPAPDSDILMPELHGGVDGATLTNDLLSLGYPNAMLLVSSYSNPLGTLRHAASLGYAVTDFLVTPLPFGHYSSEPKVRNWIRKMKTEGTAFFSERPYRGGPLSGGNAFNGSATPSGADGWYLLAGVLFQKKDISNTPDATEELIKVLTCL